MGGGSADAAAAIRGLARLWNLAVPPAAETEFLGADVPVCMESAAARVRGTGEFVEAVTCLPSFPIVLVNPGRCVHTSRVFGANEVCGSAGDLAVPPTRNLNLADAVEWLGHLRNDLETIAARLEPSIIDVKRALRATGAGLVRMTGTGRDMLWCLHRSGSGTNCTVSDPERAGGLVGPCCRRQRAPIVRTVPVQPVRRNMPLQPLA